MLLIFGFRLRTKALSRGVFLCPRCGVDRSYVLQGLRRWFTLFFLPIFPIGSIVSEQVTCETCGVAFKTQVLNVPTSAALSGYIRNAAWVCAVAMVNAGSGAASAARAAAVSVLRGAGLEDYDDATLGKDLAAFDTSNLAGYLPPLVEGLTDQGKEYFVAQLASIAIADGAIDQSERALLETVASGLHLTSTHLLGILDTVRSPGATRPDERPTTPPSLPESG